MKLINEKFSSSGINGLLNLNVLKLEFNGGSRFVYSSFHLTQNLY